MIFGVCVCVGVKKRKQSRKAGKIRLPEKLHLKKRLHIPHHADQITGLSWGKKMHIKEKPGKYKHFWNTKCSFYASLLHILVWSSNSLENRCWAHFPKLKTHKASPFARFQRSVPGRLCPGGLYGCCRWASADTGLAESTSSCKRSRTRQSPKYPGYHLCLLPIGNYMPKYSI